MIFPSRINGSVLPMFINQSKSTITIAHTLLYSVVYNTPLSLSANANVNSAHRWHWSLDPLPKQHTKTKTHWRTPPGSICTVLTQISRTIRGRSSVESRKIGKRLRRNGKTKNVVLVGYERTDRWLQQLAERSLLRQKEGQLWGVFGFTVLILYKKIYMYCA